MIFLRKYKFLLFISIILAIIPFFWLKSGEMDLGGDSNRLYFYDPLSNLKVLGIYSVTSYGIGKLLFAQVYLPFLLFLSFLRLFFSPTILIGIFNALKLSGSFIFMFLIVQELLRKEDGGKMTFPKFVAVIIAAFFYTFASSVIDNMKYALVTHNQVFLNPMMFYLLLRYVTTSSLKYLWIALLITFIFSTNFSLQAPPPLFSFYPLAIFFLLLYNSFVLKKPIPWKGIIFNLFFFLGLHAFHLFPVASNIFDKDSAFNTRVFESTSTVNSGLVGFTNLLSAGKVSEHIFLPLETQKLTWSLIIIPTLLLLGFLSIRRKNRTVLLVSVFFFITLFLVSANITHIGVEFYKMLFSIPGFGMFRNFYGQWQWVYTFFYALLIGLTMSYFFSRLKKKYIVAVTLVTIGLVFVRSWIVFNGDIVNVFHRGAKDVNVVIRIDPHYEQMLAFIKAIPNDGRILHMPFTDYAYNIVGGTNRGVYIGHSMVSFLLGKNDFSGYQDIDPFSESYVKLVKEKNYPLIKEMLSLLQVRYILLNSDEKVSDRFFTSFLYGYTGTPASQPALGKFVKHISGRKVYEVGHYSLFEVEKQYYLPHFYPVSTIFFYDENPKYNKEYMSALSFFPKSYKKVADRRIAFVEKNTCQQIIPNQVCSRDRLHTDVNDIQITYQKINPTKYRIEIKNVTKPFLLVFQDSYNEYWKLYPIAPSLDMKKISDSFFGGSIVERMPINQNFDKNPFETNGMKAAFDNTHIQVNGYANGWYIKPEDGSATKKYSMIVEMTAQKKFYYGFGISMLTFFIFLLYGIKIFKDRL